MKISNVRVPARGPSDSQIIVLGEAPGNNETIYGRPFVGGAGKELMDQLRDAGLDPDSIYFTNVFPFQPEKNNVEHYFLPKKEGITTIPPLKNGKYLNPDALQFYCDTLQSLRNHPARIIIALGNTALWALTGLQGITKYRGVWHQWEDKWILPTIHPSAILRRYQDRSTVIVDLLSVKTFLDSGKPSPLDDAPIYTIHKNPLRSDLENFYQAAAAAPSLSCDIETAVSQIRSFGFSISPTEAFVIPIFEIDTGNYWLRPEDEVYAVQIIKRICELPAPKLFQNGLYDLQYLWKIWGITVRNPEHDTYLLHHALQPELPRSLGYLGSIYTNNPAWKQMRKHHAENEKEGE